MPIEPPTCKTCKAKEWNHTCAGPVTVKVAAQKPQPKPKTAAPRQPAPPAASAPKTPKAKPKKKRVRRKYQRDLMRKRRAIETPKGG